MFNSCKGAVSAWTRSVPDLEKQMTRALMRCGDQGIHNAYELGKNYLGILKHADFV